MRRPFFKKSHKAWFYKDQNGKLVRLGKTETEAYVQWAKLATPEADAPPPPPTQMTTGELINTFLEWVGREENRSPKTYRSYVRTLQPLKELFGKLPAEELRPKDLDKVVKEKLTTYKDRNRITRRYSSTSRWHFYKTACACWNWGKDQGHISGHFLTRIKDKPQCAVRQDWIDQAQFDRVLAACDDPLLKDLLIFLWDTGCRPFEAIQVEARHIVHESRCLKFQRSRGDKVKSRRKNADAVRTIRLSDRSYKIVCDLAAKHPEGPLFRNNWSNAWGPGLLGHRLSLLRKRAGIERLTPYTLRHSFCTRLILANVNIRLIQELMGHADLDMIAKVYAHLGQSDQQLNDVLDKLVG